MFEIPDLDALKRLGEEALALDDPPERPAADGDPRERIGGYEVLDEIGRGGMGVVYTARQTGLDRIVALKVISTGTGANMEAESRFRREAQTAARLRHPHIVTVYESGRDAGCSFFSMDFVAGGDLAQAMRAETFTPRRAAELLQKVAAGVDHAHAAGVLHRDLKPSNILLDGGEPRIADFGLATLLEPGGDLTVVTGLLGTPHYLAPEAFLHGSDAMTGATDIYALGAILYELTTGRRPFAGASVGQLSQLVPWQEPPAPRLLNPLLPRDLETICLKCLAKEPTQRYASAQDLATDLGHFLADEPIQARPPSALERFVHFCRRRPAVAAMWVLLATLVLVSAASTVVVWKANHRATEQLRSALLAQAKAAQLTGRIGQRFDALAALAKAAGIRPGGDLRDAALTALALPDARYSDVWRPRFAVASPLTFDPSLERYVVEAAECQLTLNRRRDHVELRKYTPPPGRPRPLYIAPFSPDGGHFAVRFADGSAAVYDTARSEPRFVLTGRPVRQALVFFTFDFCLTPDGRELVLALPEGGVSFHDARDGRETGRIGSDTVPVIVSVSPDGRRVALVGRRSETVEIYEREGGQISLRLRHPAPVANCIWRPDGRELATGCSDYHIHLWDAASGSERVLLRGHEQVPSGLAYRADGALLASSARDLTLRLWDTADGRSVLMVPYVAGGAALGFSPAGSTLSFSSQDWEVATLELAFGDVRASIWRSAPGDYADEVFCLDTTTDDRLVVLASRSGIRLFAADSGKLLADLRQAPGALRREFSADVQSEANLGARSDDTAAQFSPAADALVYSVGGSGTWRRTLRWTSARALQIGPAVRLDERRGLMVTAVSAGPTARMLLLGARAPLASVVNLAGDERPHDIPLAGIPSDGGFSPDGKAVLTADFPGSVARASDVRFWDAKSGKLIKDMGLGAGGAAEFHPDGKSFFASGGGAAMIYAWPSLQPVSQKVLPIGDGRYAPTGSLLAISGFDRIALLLLPSERLLGNLPGGAKAALRFDRSGERLFVYEGFHLHCWNLAALRRAMAAIGLDWEAPPLAVRPASAPTEPITVTFSAE